MTKPEQAKKGYYSAAQVNFSFRTQPKRNSKYGVLLSYINEDSAELTRRERILNALAAFWLPFAYRYQSKTSFEELQHLAQTCIYQLQLHILYLRDTFGLSDNEPQVYAFTKPAKNPSCSPVPSYSTVEKEDDDDCQAETDIVSAWR